MGGLGDKAYHYHQMLGYVLNYFHIEEVWLIGKNTEAVLQTYLGEARVFNSKKALKQQLENVLYPGLSILIKGSRHLQLEEIL